MARSSKPALHTARFASRFDGPHRDLFSRVRRDSQNAPARLRMETPVASGPRPLQWPPPPIPVLFCA